MSESEKEQLKVLRHTMEVVLLMLSQNRSPDSFFGLHGGYIDAMSMAMLKGDKSGGDNSPI